MDYTKIDLNASATKGYADISAFSAELGNLANNMKSQQILKLLNHQVILEGLAQLKGLDSTFDNKVCMLLENIENALEKKKTPFLKIFISHISVFIILFIITIVINPDSFNIGYLISSVGMGCATSVLNLMLLRERKKYTFNQLFFLLEEEKIEQLEPLHKRLALEIETFKNKDENDTEKLEKILKKTIQSMTNK